VQLRGWDLEAQIDNPGEVGREATVSDNGTVYIGRKYAGETVTIAFEVQDE